MEKKVTPSCKKYAVQSSVENEQAEALNEHRAIQEQITEALEKAFGEMIQCKPQFWSRRAYWVLAGAIYERIALQRKDIPTEELVAIAKSLMESRRLELDEKGATKTPTKRAKKMSEDDVLADAVRRIYGVEMKSPKVEIRNSRTGAEIAN